MIKYYSYKHELAIDYKPSLHFSLTHRKNRLELGLPDLDMI